MFKFQMLETKGHGRLARGFKGSALTSMPIYAHGQNEMNRRSFLGRIALGSAAALSAGAFCARAAEAPRHPNILVILTDDQGWGDVRIHGNDVIVTPVMDRLAGEGAQFDRFYVSPVCAPTRAGFLTGRYYLRTGVTGVTHGEETMRSEERDARGDPARRGIRDRLFRQVAQRRALPQSSERPGLRRVLRILRGPLEQLF